MRFVVFQHMGAWKIQYDGGKSGRYRSKADALKVAFGLAKNLRGAVVLVKEDSSLTTFQQAQSDLRYQTPTSSVASEILEPSEFKLSR